MVTHPPCAAFSKVIRDHLPELKQFQSARRFERHEVIYSEESPADELFLIDSGRVKLVRVSSQAKEKIIAIYQDGDFFGELCICGAGLKREDKAVALEKASTVSFKIEGVLSLLTQKPELALELLVLVCHRLAEYQDEIATLAFDPIPQRLAKELLRLSQLASGEAPREGRQLETNLTHEELAKLVGTSREIVTTVMNQFRNDHLVDYSRRNIIVYPVQLSAYLEKSSL